MSFAGIIRESFDYIHGTEATVLQLIVRKCCFEDNPDFRFNAQLFPLKRGEWVTSVSTIEYETGLSRQQIRSALARLQLCQIITMPSTNLLTKKATLIKVIDIGKFLINKDEPTNTATKTSTIGQPSGNHRLTIINNDNNADNENKELQSTNVDTASGRAGTQLTLEGAIGEAGGASPVEITDSVVGENPLVKGKTRSLEQIQAHKSLASGLQILRDLRGSPIGSYDKNRYALKRLSEAHTFDIVIQYITVILSPEVRSDEFAPTVNDYVELERKWLNVENYLLRKGKNKAFNGGYNPNVQY